ncbi:hypothetical protein AFLA_011001 [Aspergillus flavus NRRL3357]|nr:hypothetical protein AFLA_011001 [Aspergillus flavus NRRL3357]
MARVAHAPDRVSMGVCLSMRLEYGPYDIPGRSCRLFEIFIPTMNSVSVYSRDRLPHGCDDSGLRGIHRYSVRRLLLKVEGVKTQWTLRIPPAHSDNLILCKLSPILLRIEGFECGGTWPEDRSTNTIYYRASINRDAQFSLFIIHLTQCGVHSVHKPRNK